MPALPKSGPHKLWAVLLSGLVLRLILAPFLAQPSDTYSWYFFGEGFLNGGQSFSSFFDPYRYALFLFAIPATAAFNVVSRIVPTFSILVSSLNPSLNPGQGITIIPGVVFDFLVKLPLIASDTVISLLLYKIVMKYRNNEQLALSAVTMWFLNPLVIWISSGWGTFDTLPALFTVIALFLVLEGKFELSAVSLVLAVAMKYYAAVLFVPVIILTFGSRGLKGTLKVISLAICLGAIMFLPFLTQNLGYNSLVVLGNSSGLFYSGLSFWTAITLFERNFPIDAFSYSLLVSSLGVFYYWVWRHRSRKDFTFLVSCFVIPILLVLLLFRFVGEDFLVWMLPLAVPLVDADSAGKRLYWALSAIALVSSLTDSLLPYYLLPMSNWIGGFLITTLGEASPYRVAPNGVVDQTLSIGRLYLSFIGILFSSVLMLMIWHQMKVASRVQYDA